MYIAVFIVTPTVGILYKEFYRSFTVSCSVHIIHVIHLYIYLHSYWKIGTGIKHLKNVQISELIYYYMYLFFQNTEKEFNRLQ